MKNQPIFYLDCDDILLDFRGAFLEFLKHQEPLLIGDLDLSQYVASKMGYNEFVGPDKFLNMLRAFGTTGGWRNIKALTGAAALTQTLRGLGAKVVILTSIAASDGHNRILNLIDEGIEFDEIYFTLGAKKHDLVNALNRRFAQGGNRGDSFFVDDMAGTCNDVVKNDDVGDVSAFTLDFPYNDAAFDKMTAEEIDGIRILPHYKKNLTDTYQNLYDVLIEIASSYSVKKERVA